MSNKTANYSDWFYKLVKQSGHFPQYEMKCVISGNIVYNVNTGKIKSYSQPVFNLESISLSGFYSGSASNISTKAILANDGYSITASATFSPYLTAYYPVGPGTVPRFHRTDGPFTGSIKVSGK